MMNNKLGNFIFAAVVVSLPGMISVQKKLVAGIENLATANVKQAENCVQDGGQWVPRFNLFISVPGDGFCALPQAHPDSISNQ